jgi:hypothetical protein
MSNVALMKAVLLILVLMAFPRMGLSFQSQVLEFEVKIFQIPAYQSIVSSVPSLPKEEGVVRGIRGTRTGGYITGFFPDGIVLIETDLCNNHEDIIQVIRKKVLSARPDWVQILPLADVQVRFDRDSLGGVAGGRTYAQRHKHLEIGYDFEAIPLAVSDEEIVVKIIFILKETTGEDKILLDQTFGLKFAKTLIVGFPTNDDSGRGTLFWLACSIKD